MDPAPATPRRLLELLRDGPRQAQELADALSVDTSGIRRHLEGLLAAGLVEAAQRVEGRGRPKKLYALSWQGREAFTDQSRLVLATTLDTMTRTQGPAATQALLEQVAQDLAPAMRPDANHEERLENLLHLYNRLGFDAHLEATPRGHALVQRNCGLLRAARKDPRAVCECFDEGIMRAALPGARIRLDTCIATGDTRCRHFIER